MTFFVMVLSCNTGYRIVNLIVYTPFTDPQKNYDAIIGEISKTGLSDSIHVIGRPIHISTLYFEVDSQKANKLGISVDSVYALFTPELKKTKSYENLRDLYLNSQDGNKIPVSAIASIHLISDYYKPEVYFTRPETYTYNQRNAVKLVIYTKPGQSRKIIQELKFIMQKYSTNNTSIPINTEFEIVKE